VSWGTGNRPIKCVSYVIYAAHMFVGLARLG